MSYAMSFHVIHSIYGIPMNACSLALSSPVPARTSFNLVALDEPFKQKGSSRGRGKLFSSSVMGAPSAEQFVVLRTSASATRFTETIFIYFHASSLSVPDQ